MEYRGNINEVYVSHDAAGGNGTMETPWTIEESQTNAVVGDTINIKITHGSD